MSTSNATRIKNALDKSMSTEKQFETSYGSLVGVLNDVLAKKDFASIEDVLFELADNTAAEAGNPYHKLGSTLRNRTKIKCSIKLTHDDEGYIDGVKVTRKTKSTGGRGTQNLEPTKVRDQFIASLEKRGADWLDILLRMNADKLRQAVLAAKRHAA
jgi:hypothetical protein